MMAPHHGDTLTFRQFVAYWSFVAVLVVGVILITTPHPAH